MAGLALAHERQRLFAIGPGVAHVDARRAGGDADESLPVNREEGIHGLSVLNS
jgi:hypothetical protein